MGSKGAGMDEFNSEACLRLTASDPVSNVKELTFNGCQLDPESFDTLLPLIKTLKRFEYDAGGHIVAEGQDVEPRKVIRGLLAHAGHSPEELSLDEDAIEFEGYNEDDIRSVLVKGFKKLKALHCEAKWLLCKPSDLLDDMDSEDEELRRPPNEINDPRDNLPASLEYLYLDGINKDNEWEEMVEMFKTTIANTPKLTLENFCLVWADQATYGQAVEAHVKFPFPAYEDMWKGHSYYL
ncbi:hypothetical protein E8E11_008537 [Didymella keratinophila]|nr:hypothetical protein E8E11_008537 [Didymella keratinophila]